MRKVSLVLAVALLVGMVSSLPAGQVQLDISSGFTMDTICGAKEALAVEDYNDALGPGFVLDDLMASTVLGGIDQTLTGQYTNEQLICNNSELGIGVSYADDDDWWAPEWHNATDGEGDNLPEDGVLTSDNGTVYHTASHTGNTTLPGDWTEVADPQGDALANDAIDAKLNVMLVGSTHNSASFQIAETTATLPGGQQTQYNDINLLLAAPDGSSNKFRRHQIVAIYTDDSEEVLYMAIDSGAEGAQPDDHNPDASLPAGKAPFLLEAMDFQNEYNVNSTLVTDFTTNSMLYEFKVPLILDTSKSLKAIKIGQYSNANWQARGMAVLAVTGWEVGTAGAMDADASTVEVSPNVAPDNGSALSTVTVVLKDADHNRITGQAGNITVDVAGTGDGSVGAFTEGAAGVYTADFTGSAPGDTTLTVNVSAAPLTMTQDVNVFFGQQPDANLSTVTVAASSWQYAWGFTGIDAGYRYAVVPSDEDIGGVCTFTLRDANGNPITGLADYITPEETTATGVTTFTPIVETSTGVYQCMATNDTAGLDRMISCSVDVTPLGGGITDVAAADDLDVFEPGEGEWPLADAGGDQTVAAGSTISLDCSLSEDPDAPYILDACMAFLGYDGFELGATTGVDCQLTPITFTLPVGVHEVWLVVSEDRTTWHQQRYDIDIVTITVEAPVVDTVNLDISSAMNYDWVGTQEEATLARAWYDEQPPTPDDATVKTAFSDPAGIALLAPDWMPRFFTTQKHHSHNAYNNASPGNDPTNPNTIPQVISTAYANYALEPFQAADMGVVTDAVLNPSMNGIRIGTSRGASNGDVYDIDGDGPAGLTVDTDDPPDGIPDVDPDDIDRSISSTSVALPGDQQGTYSDVNFLMFGRYAAPGTPVDTDDPPDAVPDYNVMGKAAWVKIYAVYAGGEELVWTSPKIQTHPGAPYGTPEDNDIAGAIPCWWGMDTTYQADWDAGYAAAFASYLVATADSICGYGGGPSYSTIGDGDVYLHEVAGSIALDQSQVLQGFRFEVDNGPNLWATGYPEGNDIIIAAAAATVSEGGDEVIEISASADFDWVYPNATVTTNGVDQQATITIDMTTGGADTYTIAIGQDGGALVDFQIPTASQLAWTNAAAAATVDVAGGLIGASTGAHTLNVTVTGDTMGGVATADVAMKLRVYGDVNDSGAVDTTDKLEINRFLNGIATTATFRELDLTGDGSAIDTSDKLQINRVLNGIAIP